MNKWLKILLSQNSLRKALGFDLFFQATKTNHHLEIIENFVLPSEQTKVLVLAPHSDDDCFGCGGVIKKISVAAEVTVAYFCDGSGGVKAGEKRDNHLIEQRKKEAREAGQILGVKEQIFWNFRDGTLQSSVSAVKILTNLIEKIKPEIIFLPSFVDNHPDHRGVNEILVKILEKNVFKGQIWAYEVWTPMFANRIVLINDQIEAKKSAIQKFQSQLGARGYEKAILGLNQYRAEINNREGFAEAFFTTTPEIYCELFKKS